MKSELRSCAAVVTAFAVSMLCVPANLQAQSPIVSPKELRQDLKQAAETRQSNLQALHRVLSTETGQAELKKHNINGSHVQKAFAQLSDDELSRLADQARAAEADVEAGAVVTILAIIGLIVVIIIVIRAVS